MARRASGQVGIVGHDHDRRVDHARVGGGCAAQTGRDGGGAGEVGDAVEQRSGLGVAVARAADRVGIEAERDVVDEAPIARLAEIDADLGAVVERAERRDGMAVVKAGVAGEVVPRPDRHDEEGQVPIRGDAGHLPEGPVASGDSEQICPAVRGMLGEIPQVGAGLDHHDGGAGTARAPGQVEPGGRPAT